MRLKKLKLLVTIFVSLSVLIACTTNINGDFCLLYEPVYADYEKDTPETIKQIDRNNVVYDDLCMKNIPYSAE